MLLAVADGHGDARHDRSARGAQIAVASAQDVLLSFARTFYPQGPDVLKREFRANFPRRVVMTWHERIRKDFRKYPNTSPPPVLKPPLSLAPPLMPAPPSAPTSAATPASADRILSTRYGTTLLAALILPDVLLAGQIGDGDVVVQRTDGSIETPLETIDSLVGGETFSMSSSDAPLLWRLWTGTPSDLAFLSLSTDGLRNAFAGKPEFLAMLKSLRENVERWGARKVRKILPGYLDHYSRNGSGDDISLVAARVRNALPAENPSVINSK